jgi:hypothetical protein
MAQRQVWRRAVPEGQALSIRSAVHVATVVSSGPHARSPQRQLLPSGQTQHDPPPGGSHVSVLCSSSSREQRQVPVASRKQPTVAHVQLAPASSP